MSNQPNLENMNYADLTDLIARAEALRAEQGKRLRDEVEEKARLLGLEVHENGKPPRRKRAATQQDPEA